MLTRNEGLVQEHPSLWPEGVWQGRSSAGHNSSSENTMLVHRLSIRRMWWIDLVKSLNARVERRHGGVYGLGRHGSGRTEP